ncbi:hypothetical protein CXF78_09075, partial [Shewanella sp. 11B5]|uniref:protein adenylyltransferase SelO family protein n=1 Tax=Shewanella sp. 11B5 TaxID=2058298 RepID=UPI000CAB9458
PQYQPWTGGGQHFAFLNQGVAAERNFLMFCTALSPLLMSTPDYLEQLQQLVDGFATEMQTKMEQMWAAKLGLNTFDAALFNELETLMLQTPVDYTLFFRELSSLPDDISPLTNSFYRDLSQGPQGLEQRWSVWLAQWQTLLGTAANSTMLIADADAQPRNRDDIIAQMQRVNPKYTLREWLLVPAYQQASVGNYALVRELQKVMTQPYAEQSQEVEDKYYRLKASEFFGVGGCSHLSCSS